jgi:hypothetical protein
MADTKHPHVPALHQTPELPVEGDGINYRGIVWFVVTLTIVTLVCQILVWALFVVFDKRAASTDTPRSALAAPQGTAPPAPNLLTNEPGNLHSFREGEDKALSTYEWVDKDKGVVRIPIDRAKELLLERGLPVRGAEAATKK